MLNQTKVHFDKSYGVWNDEYCIFLARDKSKVLDGISTQPSTELYYDRWAQLKS